MIEVPTWGPLRRSHLLDAWFQQRKVGRYLGRYAVDPFPLNASEPAYRHFVE
jgi:hypothetical protein